MIFSSTVLNLVWVIDRSHIQEWMEKQSFQTKHSYFFFFLFSSLENFLQASKVSPFNFTLSVWNSFASVIVTANPWKIRHWLFSSKNFCERHLSRNFCNTLFTFFDHFAGLPDFCTTKYLFIPQIKPQISKVARLKILRNCVNHRTLNCCSFFLTESCFALLIFKSRSFFI